MFSIQVVYTNIWNSVDPYASYNNQASNMLTELRTYWNTKQWYCIQRLSAHDDQKK